MRKKWCLNIVSLLIFLGIYSNNFIDFDKNIDEASTEVITIQKDDTIDGKH